MPRVVWFLPLLLFALPAEAANRPQVVQRCPINNGSNGGLVFPNGFAWNCILTNVTSGNTIMLGLNGNTSPASFTITTATESFTCPGGSKTTSGNLVTQGCYVQLASSHATFNIGVTTNSGSGGAYVMIAEEVAGLGAFDSGSASAVTGSSMTTTTANANEYIWSFCGDFSFGLQTGSGFSQNTESDGQTSGARNARALSQYQIAGAAGNYTTACTSTGGSLTALQIVALAFQQSSPPAVPAVAILQVCQQTTFTGGAGGIGGCRLNNVQSGNKVVITQIVFGIPSFGTLTSVSTETQTYVAGTFNMVTYGGNAYGSVISYVDLASSHSIFETDTSYTSCPGCSAVSYYAMEVTGLLSGSDTGSACWASATSCNYTTATPNEFTVMTAGDTDGAGGGIVLPNQMTPGNSFLPAAFSYGANDFGVVGQNLLANKTTVSSGSNTASYSQTGSTSPIMSVLAFGPSPVGSGSHSKFKIL